MIKRYGVVEVMGEGGNDAMKKVFASGQKNIEQKNVYLLRARHKPCRIGKNGRFQCMLNQEKSKVYDFIRFFTLFLLPEPFMTFTMLNCAYPRSKTSQRFIDPVLKPLLRMKNFVFQHFLVKELY